MCNGGKYKQGEKTTLKMEKIIANKQNWSKINLQNIQAPHTTQYQKSKQPNQKVGKGPKETFLQRRHTDGKQAHEKMFNITHY